MTTWFTDRLADAIAALPDPQRAAVVLRYYEDLAERDVAAALRCSPAAVESLLHRALRTLRVDLDGGVPAAAQSPGTNEAHQGDDVRSEDEQRACRAPGRT